MSESVVISKELRDRLINGWGAVQYYDDLEALRAAPETVSLEGVDRWDPIKEDGCATYDKHPTGALILFSDACRLVYPMLPSTVMSKETILKELGDWPWNWEIVNGERGEKVVQSLDYIAEVCYALQLSKLVAPVQTSATKEAHK